MDLADLVEALRQFAAGRQRSSGVHRDLLEPGDHTVIRRTSATI
jgi:hypothetical protein